MAAVNVTPTEDQLYAMSMDELRKLDMDAISKKAAEEAAAATTTTTDPVVPPVTGPDPAVSDTKRVYQSERTIDLGDGAGVQVFRATGDTELKAERALTDKLAQAQVNATRKIRQQEAQIKAAKPETVTAADEAVLSNEMLSNPTEAVKKIFKSITGMDINQFKSVTEKAAKFGEAQEKQSIVDKFIASHPDYVDNDRNAKRLAKAVELQGGATQENFEKAYQDLSESGLLEVKASGASDEQKKADAEAKRIADAAEAASSQRTKRSSGLSTQRTSVTPPPAALTEEDMYALPLEEIRKRANQHLQASH